MRSRNLFLALVVLAASLTTNAEARHWRGRYYNTYGVQSYYGNGYGAYGYGSPYASTLSYGYAPSYYNTYGYNDYGYSPYGAGYGSSYYGNGYGYGGGYGGYGYRRSSSIGAALLGGAIGYGIGRSSRRW